MWTVLHDDDDQVWVFYRNGELHVDMTMGGDYGVFEALRYAEAQAGEPMLWRIVEPANPNASAFESVAVKP